MNANGWEGGETYLPFNKEGGGLFLEVALTSVTVGIVCDLHGTTEPAEGRFDGSCCLRVEIKGLC